MIHIIITSYNEPKATLRAANIFLKAKTKEKIQVIVVDPFPEVEEFLRAHIKDKRFEFILDSGEGKSFALNNIFTTLYSENKDDLMVFTDGDVYVSENTLAEIIKSFKDKKVGAVTGRTLAVNSPREKYGYWAKVSYDGIDKVRKRLTREKKFLQCSGYLFAIRNGIIKEIPIDVPEDCVIPYLVWKEGFQVKYLPQAEVYIKYPDNWKDWINQRTRTIKAHENISTLIPDMPRTKSFYNEVKEGLLFSLTHPKNIQQFYWLIQLYFARLYIYYRSFRDAKKKAAFNPAWRDDEVQSAKPLD